MMKALVCLLLLALAGALQLSTGADIDIKYPVRSAAEDEITSLPGLNRSLSFKQYSGYLEADDEKNRFWHYWMVESQSNPDEDPIVLWLNGGPGCSSLLGLLTELGPFSVASNGELNDNPYAWNQHANIIFMESPAGVGFSYAADGSVKADDDTTAKQNHRALQSFFHKFPQFAGRSLYLTGESYGGVYLPTLAVLVDKDPKMNLAGVAIGNGYLNANKLAESLIYFGYYHGLIGQTSWKRLSSECCNGKAPARGNCDFSDAKRSEQCGNLIEELTNSFVNSGLNPYNLYDRCAQPDQTSSNKIDFVGREHFDKSLMMHALNLNSTRFGRGARSGRTRPQQFQVRVRGDPPCTDDSITINYLNRKEVKEALHIPDGLKPFTTCFDEIQYTMIYPGSKDGLAPQMNQLINSPHKLKLLVYNGDTDMMCNAIGDEWFVDDLGRKVVGNLSPWYVNGQVAGFVKHFEGIAFATVKGSGHMVPTDKPAEALHMFNDFLEGHHQ